MQVNFYFTTLRHFISIPLIHVMNQIRITTSAYRNVLSDSIREWWINFQSRCFMSPNL